MGLLTFSYQWTLMSECCKICQIQKIAIHTIDEGRMVAVPGDLEAKKSYSLDSIYLYVKYNENHTI